MIPETNKPLLSQETNGNMLLQSDREDQGRG